MRHEEEAAALAVVIIEGFVEVDAVWCFALRSQSGRCSGSFSSGDVEVGSVHLYLLVFGKFDGDGLEGWIFHGSG